jgi:hypothetical protein
MRDESFFRTSGTVPKIIRVGLKFAGVASFCTLHFPLHSSGLAPKRKTPPRGRDGAFALSDGRGSGGTWWPSKPISRPPP